MGAVSGSLHAQGNSEAAFERVREVQLQHTAILMAQEGVLGTAIGLNERGQPALAILLERPGIAGIPKWLDGVPVEPVVTGKIYAVPKPENPGGKDKPGQPSNETNPKKRFDRPVPIGVSTGNVESCSAGTIGCRVTDGSNVYALSNNHVYALENTATEGSNVVQPGLYDTKPPCRVYPENVIGTLADYVKLEFDGTPNYVDAALALTDTARLGNATPVNGYGVPNSTTTQASIGLRVQKYGRTTGLTKGSVSLTDATVVVSYGSVDATFEHQIIITPSTFSGAGDSGSLIVTDDPKKNPVGLLFAGSSTVTVANPIDFVFALLGVWIDDE